jgi:hypothetical protein
MESKDRPCQNCGSVESYVQTGTLMSTWKPILLFGGIGSAPFQIRICGSCGLVEWFSPPEYLDDVKVRLQREG